MVKPIVKDIIFLSQKAAKADESDLQTVTDLLDTLKAHDEECIGMAANMIGVCKSIIVFKSEGKYHVMINPEVTKCSGEYDAKEGCLSLTGIRPAKRYKSIKVSYLNENMQSRVKSFNGFEAQIIQHEMDHCKGIII